MRAYRFAPRWTARRFSLPLKDMVREHTQVMRYVTLTSRGGTLDGQPDSPPRRTLLEVFPDALRADELAVLPTILAYDRATVNARKA